MWNSVRVARDSVTHITLLDLEMGCVYNGFVG